MKSFIPATIALVALSTVAAQDTNSTTCTAETLTSARNACDSVADVSQLKCDNEACHEALHSLVEDDTRQCYVDLGLGPVTDLDYYVLLDEFCHGDGADPANLAASSTAGNNSTSSGTGGTTVGDHDHDHDHSHDHDHDHSHSHEESGSTSSSSSADTIAQSLAALQVVALAAVTLLV